MSEEEENQNLLDRGFSGITKVFGGNTKIIAVILVAVIAFIVARWLKQGKVKW